MCMQFCRRERPGNEYNNQRTIPPPLFFFYVSALACYIKAISFLFSLAFYFFRSNFGGLLLTGRPFSHGKKRKKKAILLSPSSRVRVGISNDFFDFGKRWHGGNDVD